MPDKPPTVLVSHLGQLLYANQMKDLAGNYITDTQGNIYKDGDMSKLEPTIEEMLTDHIIELVGGLRSDQWITKMVDRADMIEPFVDRQVSKGVISYGLSSYGYDIRVADEFKIFHNLNSGVVDPKNFDPKNFTEMTAKEGYIVIAPNSFALGRSVEYIKIPQNVTGILLGKSTYARCGIIVNFTPLEAGWNGHITIEISNTTPLPARVYANEGIAQVLFFQSPDICMTSYSDKGGQYMHATGIQLPKVEG